MQQTTTILKPIPIRPIRKQTHGKTPMLHPQSPGYNSPQSLPSIKSGVDKCRVVSNAVISNTSPRLYSGNMHNNHIPSPASYKKMHLPSIFKSPDQHHNDKSIMAKEILMSQQRKGNSGIIRSMHPSTPRVVTPTPPPITCPRICRPRKATPEISVWSTGPYADITSALAEELSAQAELSLISCKKLTDIRDAFPRPVNGMSKRIKEEEETETPSISTQFSHASLSTLASWNELDTNKDL